MIEYASSGREATNLLPSLQIAIRVQNGTEKRIGTAPPLQSHLGTVLPGVCPANGAAIASIRRRGELLGP